MRWKKIPDAVVRRLPVYLRVLEEASQDDDERRLISSQELGRRAGVSPALVRKDLAWFGEFGKQGVGYEIPYLKEELRRILNVHREVRVGLIGVGSLGRALARYHRGRRQQDGAYKISLVALFDNDLAKVGEMVDDLEIWPVGQLPEKVRQLQLQMILVSVPAPAAQEVVDLAVAAGIRAILNFAPTKVVVPDGVHIANADVSLELQRLAYYLES